MLYINIYFSVTIYIWFMRIQFIHSFILLSVVGYCTTFRENVVV